MANAADAYGLFVSCVRGCPVTRFGTRTLIGAERTRDNVIHWFPDRVVTLTHAEYARHRKEYGRLIADGELRVRTAAEWSAQVQAAEQATQAKAKARAAATPPHESKAHDSRGATDPPIEDRAT